MTTSHEITQGEPILSDFTILVDSREQAPFAFLGFTEIRTRQRNKQQIKVSHPYVVQCTTATLTTGDYSIDGLQSQITIERKSLSDLVGTLTADRDRFVRELERMSDEEFRFTSVVVEASWPMLLHSNEYRLPVKKSVTRSVIAFQQRYRTQWHFAGSRREAERWTLRSLERFWADREGQ